MGQTDIEKITAERDRAFRDLEKLRISKKKYTDKCTRRSLHKLSLYSYKCRSEEAWDEMWDSIRILRNNGTIDYQTYLMLCDLCINEEGPNETPWEMEDTEAKLQSYRARFRCDNCGCKNTNITNENMGLHEDCSPKCDFEYGMPYWDFCWPWEKPRIDPRITLKSLKKLQTAAKKVIEFINISDHWRFKQSREIYDLDMLLSETG